jgi:acylphosphatase
MISYVDMKTLKIRISGLVQGVFFRKFVKEMADELGVRGFVRNVDGGAVEIVVEGEDGMVNKMLDRCKKGNMHSEVKEVELEQLKHQGLDGFKISYM